MDDAECDSVELPTPELREAAERLFGETTSTRREKLTQMRQKMDSLPPDDRLADLSARSLIRFLRGRKFDVDRALQSAVNMARFFKQHQAWVQDLDSEDFSSFASWIQLLETRDPEGRVILILRLAHGLRDADVENLKKTDPQKLVRWNMWFITQLTWNLHVQVYGIVIINAFGEMSLADVSKLRSILNIHERIEVFKFIGSSCPFRVRGVFVFDEPVIFRWLWSVIHVFLSPKLRDRFHICGKNYAALKEVLPDVSFLPTCLGGGVDDESCSWKASHDRFKTEMF